MIEVDDHVAVRRSLVIETRSRLVSQWCKTEWSMEAGRRSLVMRDTFPHPVVLGQLFERAYQRLSIDDQLLVRVVET